MPRNIILGGSPDANQLAYEIIKLCDRSACEGFEMIGALESVQFQLISEANNRSGN